MRQNGIGRTAASLLLVVVVLAASLTYVIVTPHSVKTSTGTQTVTQSSTTTQTTESTTTITAPPLYSGPPLGPGPSVFGAEEWNLTISGYSYPPDSVAFNPSSGEIYLMGGSSDVVTMVDSRTHRVSGTFTIPDTIYIDGIIADSKPDTLLAFATFCSGEPNANATTCPPADIAPGVYELNGTTKSVIREFPAEGGFAADFAQGRIYEMRDCPNPNGVAMNPDYPNCGFLLAYGLSSGALLANVSLNAPPYGIAVNPERHTVYLVAGLFSSEEFLAVNGTSDQVTLETPLSTISTPVLQADAGTNTVYALATNQSSTFITAINGTDGKILYSSPVGSACTVDSNRYYVNPVASQIYPFRARTTPLARDTF